MTSSLTRLCYAVVRAQEPECVVETGVCYGVTSFFILAALARNSKGNLYSIDLPPLGQDADRFVGSAIPDGALKTRWHLHRGVSRRILLGVLGKTKTTSRPLEVAEFDRRPVRGQSGNRTSFGVIAQWRSCAEVDLVVTCGASGPNR